MATDTSLKTLEIRLSSYIKTREPDQTEPEIKGLERLGAGSSREMYRFNLIRRSSVGQEIERRPIILRKDPLGQGLVSTSERRVEYAVIAALQNSTVPVPEVFWLEEDPQHLGAPFFAMTEVTGCEVDGALFSETPFDALRQSIARDKWSIMGQLARLDPAELRLLDVFPAFPPDQIWERELDFWEEMLVSNQLAPQPITAATIRHLRRNPPSPPRKLSLVHGDFRTGNFLFGNDGRVHALLDWEMAHLGDPLEDLAYSLTVQYASPDGSLAGNLAPVAQAIAYWEEASGLKADADDLKWWRLFTTVKFQGLWASGARGWQQCNNDDIVMIAAAWSCGATHEREALHLMDKI